MPAGVDIEAALWELQKRGLFYQDRAVPEVEFSFKHVITQESVYQSLSPDRRRNLHAGVASAIEEIYPELSDEHAETLAYHHERSGNTVQAVGYLLRAGIRPRRNYANNDAIKILSRGMELLSALPKKTENQQRRLEFLLAVGVPTVFLRGIASSQARRVYEEAVVLSRTIGTDEQQFEAVLGLRRNTFGMGKMTSVAKLNAELQGIGRRSGNIDYICRSYVMTSEALFWAGEYPESLRFAMLAEESYISEHRLAQARLFGTDTGVFAIIKALARWHEGNMSAATADIESYRKKAKELGHPINFVVASIYSAIVYQLCDDPERMLTILDPALEVSWVYGTQFLSSWAGGFRGWATGRAGDLESGMDIIRESLATGANVIGTVTRPCNLTLLGDLLLQAGRLDEAETALSESIDTAKLTGLKGFLAEALRLKGEAVCAAEASRRSEITQPGRRYFEQAIECARAQGSVQFSERARRSLAKHYG